MYILNAAPELAKTVLTNIPNTPADQAKKTRDHLHDVEHTPDALDGEAAQPQEIVYGKDVALDMTGHHSAEGVGENPTTPAKRTPQEGRSTVPSIVVPTTVVDLAFAVTRGKAPLLRPGRGRLAGRAGDDPERGGVRMILGNGALPRGTDFRAPEDVVEGGAKPSSSSQSREDASASTSFGQGGHLFPDDWEKDLSNTGSLQDRSGIHQHSGFDFDSPLQQLFSIIDEHHPPTKHKNYIKTLRLSSDQLKVLNLPKGADTITFSLGATGVIACTAKISVRKETDRVVISSIDGTITESEALGHIFNLIGRDWAHLGVAKLYTDIARDGYRMMYLTPRAIGQADSTRDYLKGIEPEGPAIASPDRLMASLHRQVLAASS
ncbi:hypothetical protein FRC01_003178 [Tulasnella sp. 417]|nr:hypothetical protein FRC01_003178 [Tulasnella sp. 417]